MLKIKDNVDLKELKKYGFKYLRKLRAYTYNSIDIRENDRKIYIIFNFADEEILYDLIKADLVEKVGDE